MQVLNEANKLAATNLQNHISVNLFSRTRRWLALKVLSWQDPYIVGLSNRQFQSWLTLLLRASTNADNQASVAHLLPRFTSLQLPPPNMLHRLQSLVDVVRQRMGPLPATTKKVQNSYALYLPWLYKVLHDFSWSHGQLQHQHTQLQQQLNNLQQHQQPYQPHQQLQMQQLQQQLKVLHRQWTQAKLFTLLPQKGNQQAFITITTACLHRYNDQPATNVLLIAHTCKTDCGVFVSTVQ